ncbi:MAG: DNA-directed RNA polymerase subunit delta [Bacilli bacterium]|nr:DNA-directed RNA polymerase subunit delta [Bacilli bacterium]
MPEKSLTQYAYDVLTETKAPLAFADLFKAALAKAGMSELSDSQLKVLMSRFYTSLTVDGKFFCLQNNQWDLRYRHTEKEISEVLEAAYSDDIEEESESFDSGEDEMPDELKEDKDEDEEESDEVDYDRSKTSEEF